MDDDSDRDEHTSLLDTLLEAVRRAAATDGEYHASGRSERGPGRVDYGYSVRTGLGPGAPGRRGHPAFDRAGDAAADDRPTRVAADGPDRLVTVDLGDAEATDTADVSATVDGPNLTVAVGTDPVARVRLTDDGPWRVASTELNNGVLGVRVCPA